MKTYHLLKLINCQYSVSDIIDYFRGNIRYWLFYHIPWLLSTTTTQQFLFRVRVMNKDCFNNGECVVCGCRTLNLQFSNKGCEGHCYPKMMSKSKWKEFIGGKPYYDGNMIWKFDDNNMVIKITKEQAEFEDEMLNLQL